MHTNPTLTAVAKTISVVLHPVLMPVYVLALMMCEGLLLAYATTENKLSFAAVILLNTVAVPMICTFMFSRIRFWSKESNPDFRERILPMAVMIICYGACLLMIRDVPFALPVRKMLTAGICCLMLGLTVSFFWKISLHMIAQGAVVAFLGVIFFEVQGQMVISGARYLMPTLCVSIALAAMVASSRLLLGRHDALQVAAGFAGGFVITILSLYYL